LKGICLSRYILVGGRRSCRESGVLVPSGQAKRDGDCLCRIAAINIRFSAAHREAVFAPDFLQCVLLVSRECTDLEPPFEDSLAEDGFVFPTFRCPLNLLPCPFHLVASECQLTTPFAVDPSLIAECINLLLRNKPDNLGVKLTRDSFEQLFRWVEVVPHDDGVGLLVIDRPLSFDQLPD